jgi:8-oxo-dGTP diphosphatase
MILETPNQLLTPPDELKAYFSLASSVDCVVFGFDDEGIKILLIQRGTAPFENMWALPGDLVHPLEDLDHAAQRVLLELTGLSDVYLEQVHTFGRVDRHPLGRVLTVAYFSLVKVKDYTDVHAASWASEARWINLKNLSDLAFDHREILDACLLRLRKRVRARPIGFELLPEKFTLSELQYLYESILGEKLDKRNFRKKILSMHLLLPLDEVQIGVAHRPAKLYRFDMKRYEKLVSEGFTFAL